MSLFHKLICKVQYALLTVLTILIMSVTASAYAQSTVVGKVLTVTGQLKAVNVDGSSRVLNRGSTVHLGEMLTTEAKDKAQIRFSDGTLLSIKPNTAFRIDNFVQSAVKKQNRYFSTLIRGGFRAITGSIGKQNPQDFKITTPVATIGIRGTDMGAQEDPNGAFYFGTWQNQTDVSNNAGKIVIGEKEKYCCAYVKTINDEPVGIESTPPILRQAQNEPTIGAVATNTSAYEALSAFDFSNISGMTAEEYQAYLNQFAETLTRTGYANEIEFGTQAFEDKLLTLVFFDSLNFFEDDVRLVGSGTFDRFGFFIIDDELTDDEFLVESDEFVYASFADDVGTASPTFVNNSFNDLLPDYQYNVYKPGNATATLTGTSTTYGTTWGVWNGTAGAPVQELTDAFNIGAVTAIPHDVYWLVANPITTAPTGTVTYDTQVMINGAGNWTSVGALDGVSFDGTTSIDINFATAAVSGTFAVDVSQTGTPQGTFSVTGIDGVFFNDSTKEVIFTSTTNGLVTGTLTSSGAGTGGAIIGQIRGVVTGTTSDSAISGGFRFEKASDTDTYVGGVFILSQ